MEYVFGAGVGLIFGGLVGLGKYLFLWKSLLKPEDDRPITQKSFMVRMIISYVVNVVALLVTFFVRNIIPFEFVALAIATAVALSLTGKFFPIYNIKVQ